MKYTSYKNHKLLHNVFVSELFEEVSDIFNIIKISKQDKFSICFLHTIKHSDSNDHLGTDIVYLLKMNLPTMNRWKVK